MAERIHAGDFDSKVLADGTFALVDFYSDSCVPCKRMSPVLAELEESYAGKLYVGKVNIAYEPELVEKYEVSSAPTLVFFKDGKEIQRLTGVQKKADLEKFISENGSELIAQENVETPEYVTVSVNDEFAKSADFETQQLKDGDNVEFLYFMGGGQ